MAINSALTAQKTMSTLAWALLLLLAFIWGGSFVFAKVAVAEIPPFTLVLLRVGLAAATLWLICLATGIAMPRTVKAWLAYAVMGLLNNVIAFSLIFTGQQEIGASLASILKVQCPSSLCSSRACFWRMRSSPPVRSSALLSVLPVWC
jgi:drug/metabolite transporter (DMT)-like permease